MLNATHFWQVKQLSPDKYTIAPVFLLKHTTFNAILKYSREYP